MDEFEPLIIAFGCHYCTYAASDSAATARIPLPHNVRLIRVICSGMVDPIYILRAFETGADGVLVAGCNYTDCHFITGATRCDEMSSKIKGVLRILGLEDRFRREMISTSEGILYTRVIEEMVNNLKELGPSPLRKEITACP